VFRAGTGREAGGALDPEVGSGSYTLQHIKVLVKATGGKELRTAGRLREAGAKTHSVCEKLIQSWLKQKKQALTCQRVERKTLRSGYGRPTKRQGEKESGKRICKQGKFLKSLRIIKGRRLGKHSIGEKGKPTAKERCHREGTQGQSQNDGNKVANVGGCKRNASH